MNILPAQLGVGVLSGRWSRTRSRRGASKPPTARRDTWSRSSRTTPTPRRSTGCARPTADVAPRRGAARDGPGRAVPAAPASSAMASSTAAASSATTSKPAGWTQSTCTVSARAPTAPPARCSASARTRRTGSLRRTGRRSSTLRRGRGRGRRRDDCDGHRELEGAAPRLRALAEDRERTPRERPHLARGDADPGRQGRPAVSEARRSRATASGLVRERALADEGARRARADLPAGSRGRRQATT